MFIYYKSNLGKISSSGNGPKCLILHDIYLASITDENKSQYVYYLF